MASKPEKAGFNELVKQVNKQVRVNPESLVRHNPELAAMMSKMIYRTKRNPVGMNNSGAGIDQNALIDISNTIKDRTKDSENMMQLFPDLELSAQILISSIISPKDMMNTEIIYKTKDNFLPNEVTTSLVNVIKDNLEIHYSMKKDLNKYLRDMLFVEGSHVKLVIPEASLDAVINDTQITNKNDISLEDLQEYSLKKQMFSFDNNQILKIKNIGLLGNNATPTKSLVSGLSLETFNNRYVTEFNEEVSFKTVDKNNVALEADSFVTVTDNFNILKLPKLIELNNRVKIKNIIKQNIENTERTISVATENSNTSYPFLEKTVYKGSQPGAKIYTRIRSLIDNNRKSIGRPLVMHVPSEAVIPVHVPGNEEQHVGYFLLIDEEGNFISKNNNYKYSSTLQSSLNNTQNSMSSFLLQKAKNNLVGNNNISSISIDQATRIYSEVIEDDLLNRLKNGRYGTNLAISKTEDIYRIMLARTFANQYTKIVFVPTELVTYFAYRFNKNGVGKTLLDDMRILISIRAMTKFARVMASLKNSIGSTEVKMKFDENDPDPYKTMEDSINEITKTRQQSFPLGINSPTDVADWVQRSGLEFTFEGHPKIPDMSFEFNNKGLSSVQPDNELDEALKKECIEAIGLSPETVDNGFAAEFATTVVANNILLSKRVLQHQENFEPLLTDYAKKISTNDYVIRDSLSKIIMDNMDKIKEIVSKNSNSSEGIDTSNYNDTQIADYVIDEFIERLELTLPKPSNTTLVNQMADLDAYIAGLEKALDSYISSEIITSDMSGEISGNIDTIKSIVKSGLVRNYLTTNNILPELLDLVAQDEDGKPKMDLYKIQSEHLTGIIASSVNLIKYMKKIKDAADKDLNTLGSEGGDGGESSSPEDTSTGEDTASGGDEFGLDTGGGPDIDNLLDDGSGSDTDTGGGEDTAKPEGDDTVAGADKVEEKEDKDTKDENQDTTSGGNQ